jgi:hypothetical protein
VLQQKVVRYLVVGGFWRGWGVSWNSRRDATNFAFPKIPLNARFHASTFLFDLGSEIKDLSR